MLSARTVLAESLPQRALHLSPALDGISMRHVPFAKLSHDAVDDRDVLVPHVVDHNLADVRLFHQISVPYQQHTSALHMSWYIGSQPADEFGNCHTEEQKVATLEGRFHRSGQDDDDGRGRVGDDGESGEDHISP